MPLLEKESRRDRTRSLNETKMLKHLEDLGIDLTGFDLDGIDPIPSKHAPTTPRYGRIQMASVLA